MATVGTNYDFNTGLMAWSYGTVSGTSTGTRSTTQESTNDSVAGTGSLATRDTGKNQSNVNFWEFGTVGTYTWESIGIPAGSQVTQVVGAYDWRCSEYATGASSSTRELVLETGPGVVRGTVVAGTASYTGTTAWATRTGTLSGLTDASSTTLRFRVRNAVNTGNSSSAANTLNQDWVQLTITYQATPAAGGQKATMTLMMCGGM